MNSYDYIVVGAGTAGCVLANRLASHASVLLLEAGGPDSKREIRIPAAFPKLFKTEIDWAYFTEPEEQLNRRRLFWPRGKVYGGCSAMNAMIYIRGHRRDYDAWRDAGNPGWGFDDVLPYFLKSEKNERGVSRWHAADGLLPVSDLRCANPLSEAFVDACEEVGIARNYDFNGPEQEGAGLYQVTQSGGERWSAARAFLRPSLQSHNLRVIAHAHATRILFENLEAVGVEYQVSGTMHQAHANAEIVLACGSVNSPQLMMLSGLGPAEHLHRHGIPVICELPGVGKNLQDHLMAGVLYACTEPVTLDKAENVPNLLTYVLRRQGPFTSNVAEGGAFVRSRKELAVPDLQFLSARDTSSITDSPGRKVVASASGWFSFVLKVAGASSCVRRTHWKFLRFGRIIFPPSWIARPCSRDFDWGGGSLQPRHSSGGAELRICPMTWRKTTMLYGNTSASTVRLCITRWARARWARMQWPWWMHNFGFAECATCGSRTLL